MKTPEFMAGGKVKIVNGMQLTKQQAVLRSGNA
jgi:hypothetical protein